MKISVIIPTYNASETIQAALKSVLSQTIEVHEIIVVDDGSSDINTLEKELKLINSTNIILIKKNQNTNAAHSRNIGVHSSSGEIICFLDADDLWHATKLERQLEAIAPSTIVGCRVQAITKNGYEVLNVPSTYNRESSLSENLFGRLSHNLVFQTSSIMLYREDYIRIGGFDCSLPRHQDYQFVINAESQGLKFEFIDETLVDYKKTGKISKIKHNWSLNKSLSFFDGYIIQQPQHIKENFLIVQLLGPSIQSKSILLWIKASRSRGIISAKFLLKSFYYMVKRILK